MEKQVIEIGGVKLEVDMRFARRLDCLHIGDPVRVMTKDYDDTYTVSSGVVIGFEPFANLPTIIIAYWNGSYSDVDISFLHLNANSKDVEVVAADEESKCAFDRNDALATIDRKIEKAEREVSDLKAKREYFVAHIAQALSPVTKDL